MTQLLVSQLKFLVVFDDNLQRILGFQEGGGMRDSEQPNVSGLHE
jgi:hypothetical protein